MEARMIGTLFEDEEMDKKQNMYNQPFRDAKGSKRLHGAFTGGFSAGYWNTVGSKEGWESKQSFVSSRNNRAQQVPQQSIMDFMDEEDLGESTFNKNIQTYSQFTNPTNNIQQTQQRDQFDKMLDIQVKDQSFGAQILENMRKITKERKIRKKIQKMQQKNIQKKYDIEEAPNFMIQKGKDKMNGTNINSVDKKQLQFSYKNDYHGLGYEASAHTLLDQEELQFEKEFKQLIRRNTSTNINSMEDDDSEEERKKKQQNQIKFSNIYEGLQNNYEKETQILYNKHDMTDTNTEFDSSSLKRNSIMEAPKLKLLEISKDKNIQTSYANLERLEIKQTDYDPYKRMKQYLLESKKGNPEQVHIQKWHKQMPYAEKQKILNDEDPIRIISPQSNSQQIATTLEEKQKLIQRTMGKSELNRLLGLNKFVRGAQINSISEQQKEMQIQTSQNENQTKEEQFMLYKKINELEEAIQNTRKIEPWMPDAMLCRRFNVAQPNDGVIQYTDYMTKDSTNGSRKHVSSQVDSSRTKNEERFNSDVLPLRFGKNRKKYEARFTQKNCRLNAQGEYVEDQKLDLLQDDQEEEEINPCVTSQQQQQKSTFLNDPANTNIDDNAQQNKSSLTLFQAIFDQDDASSSDAES